MKKVLSLLMAFVFLHTQTWALSGGPDYSGGSDFPDSLIGTYGGVMIGTSTTNLAAANSQAAASMGIFSISVPQDGIALGAAIIFVRGTAFIGQVAAIADPDKKRIEGLIAGTSNYDVVIPPQYLGNDGNGDPIFTEEQTYSVFAEGTFKVKVIQGNEGAFTPAPVGSGSSSGSATGTTTTSTELEIGSTRAARLTGTATIDTFFTVGFDGTPNINETNTFSVDGLKQSNIPNDVTSVSDFGSGSGGG